MDFALLCKGFFATGTAAVLGGFLLPSFRQQIMTYGSRAVNTVQRDKSARSTLASLWHSIASFQVPHSWFTHFYVASVASSIFWAHQILTHGSVLQFIASQAHESGAPGMTINQVILAWSFMALQGTRRLYESITLTKLSQSKMWVGLWLLGMAYYICMGIAVWIEGICK